MEGYEIYWTVMISLIFITIWFIWYGISVSNSMMSDLKFKPRKSEPEGPSLWQILTT